jgi:hypothetical protein
VKSKFESLFKRKEWKREEMKIKKVKNAEQSGARDVE